MRRRVASELLPGARPRWALGVAAGVLGVAAATIVIYPLKSVAPTVSLGVRIVDQGPGVAAAERERILEPFYRGRTPDSRGWPGSGLGLPSARGFVEANGGTISVESLPGQGTSFVVSLPVERVAEEVTA